MFLNKLFESEGVQINLFTSKKLWIKYLDFMKLSFSNINLININDLPAFNYNTKYSFKYFKNLSKIIDDNLLISDNYEEIGFFKKTIILANFFWGVEKRDSAYFNSLNYNLKKNQSMVYGNRYFSGDYIRKISNYKPIGFFGPEIIKNKEKRNNNKILFVKGFGSNKKGFDNKFLFLRKCLNKKYEIIFDKNIACKNMSDVKYLDSLSNKSMSEIDLIIGRPSFGIFTEAISRKIPFYPISDINDIESIEMKRQINLIFKQYGIIDEYIQGFHNTLRKTNFEFNAEDKIILEIL